MPRLIDSRAVIRPPGVRAHIFLTLLGQREMIRPLEPVASAIFDRVARGV